MEHTSVQTVFRFGEFELDPVAGELRNHGQPIRLQPQQSQLLLVLLRDPGRVISRADLRQALWGEETFVEFEDGLNHAVIRLRSALGDSAQTPRYIETVPRRGYRFIAPVETTAAPEKRPVDAPVKAIAEPQSWPVAAPAFPHAALAVLALVALLASAMLGWRVRVLAHDGRIESLAILPLSNLTGDSGQEFLSDGVTEDLTTELARISPLRVVSRTSSRRYKATPKPVPEIGRELSVDAVVEGAVQRSGPRIRITLQLIHTANDRHLWANTYEGAIGDVPVLEAQATRDIASRIKLTLTPRNEERLRRARPVNPEAYEAYQKGRRAAAIWDRPRLLEAVKHFEEAVQKDPNYALAYAELGHAYGMLSFGLTPDENAAKFRALTQKALELDGELAEAHINLGDIRFYGDWDWSGGEAEFRHAVELDPGSVDAQEHYAICLWVLARYEDAAEEMRRALRLDPLSPRLNAELGSILRDQGDPQAAIPHYQKALEAEPAYAATFADLGAVYEELGRHQEAMAAYMRAASLNGEDPATVKLFGDAFDSAGMHGYWTKRLEQLQAQAKRQPISPLAFASIYVHLGQYDEALNWLERGYRQHLLAIVWIHARNNWAPLRSHPRFRALLATMKFPKQ